MSDLFPRTEVPQVNLSPSARTAAEALPLLTSGALIKQGSDGKPADASVTDAQLAIDHAKAVTLAAGGFYDAFALLAPTYAPGAGSIRGRDLWAGGPLPAAVASAVDAGIEGGGIVMPTGGWKGLSGYILQSPKTQPWAARFDAVIPVPVAGLVGHLSLLSADENSYVSLCHIGNNDTAHLILLLMLNATTQTVKSTTFVLDNARHVYTVAYDGSTTITVLVDDEVVATQTTLTNLATVPMRLAAITSSADAPNQIKVARFATATVL